GRIFFRYASENLHLLFLLLHSVTAVKIILAQLFLAREMASPSLHTQKQVFFSIGLIFPVWVFLPIPLFGGWAKTP
ncbi:hypothetical protein SOH20_25650, partial [Bacillus thuringiensis]